MQNEVCSKEQDCFDLFGKLKSNMGNRLELFGSAFKPFVTGRFYYNCNEKDRDNLPFYYKFNKDYFLRVGIGTFYPGKTCFASKLYALSSFYQTIKEYYGEPSVYFTVKDGDEDIIFLEWIFKDKERIIEDIKNSDYFTDGFTNNVIEINEYNDFNRSKAKELISKQLGLPFDLIKLVDNDPSTYLQLRKVNGDNSFEEPYKYNASRLLLNKKRLRY